MDPFSRVSGMNTVLVTSTRAYSNGSSVAADMARMIAEKGRKVALIDADPVSYTHLTLPTN